MSKDTKDTVDVQERGRHLARVRVTDTQLVDAGRYNL